MTRAGGDIAGSVPGSSWFVARPIWPLLALDMTGIALAAATIAQLGNPDVLLHMVWIVLALEAFTFGLRVATVRIAVASVFVVGYALVASGDATPMAAMLIDLDLEEWPLMAVIAIIVAIMADRVLNTGRRYAALYRAASDRLLTAQEDERRRLAADLHDGVGQTMTALALTLDAAEAALADPASQAAGRDAVRRAREMAGLAIDDARGVAFRLRPARLRETGLVAALGELAASAGLPVEFTADASLARPALLGPDSEVDAYRIVQEALGNASRHGRAQHVAISARRIGRQLRIEVADDGVGFDVAGVSGRGLGLPGMRERALAIGGTLQVRSRPGAGTTVRLDVPLPEDTALSAGDPLEGRSVTGATVPSGATLQ
jgi:signal transduction histidine kinase